MTTPAGTNQLPTAISLTEIILAAISAAMKRHVTKMKSGEYDAFASAMSRKEPSVWRNQHSKTMPSRQVVAHLRAATIIIAQRVVSRRGWEQGRRGGRLACG